MATPPGRTVVDQDSCRRAARGVYGISVAAELTGTGVQNLRLYERRGLLRPARTDGGTRRYSRDDVHRLRCIAALLADGLNLAGIAMVLGLESDNADLRVGPDVRGDPTTTTGLRLFGAIPGTTPALPAATTSRRRQAP